MEALLGDGGVRSQRRWAAGTLTRPAYAYQIALELSTLATSILLFCSRTMASQELKKQVGFETALVAVNFLLPKEYGHNFFFESRRRQQKIYLAEIEPRFHILHCSRSLTMSHRA